MADASTISVLIRAKDELSGTLQNIEGRMGRLTNNIAKHRRTIGMAMTGIGAAGLGGFGVAVKAASDLEESINAVNVVFGTGAKRILEFGKTSSQSAGLSNSSFNQLSATIGALLKDVGLPMDEVAGMVTNLTVRSADMASVMNTDVEDALSAVNQALRGETEAIRKYTGDVTEAALEQFALAEGIQKSVKDMNEQEKRLLRLSVILRDTDKFAGDFANTSESLANTMRRNAASTEDMSAAIGKALLPAVTDMMLIIGPIIHSIAEWAQANPGLTKGIVMVTAAMFALMVPMGMLIMSATALNIAMAPVTLTILAIGAVVVAAIVIWKKWDDMSTKLKVTIGLVALALGPVTAIVFGLIAAVKGIIYVKNNWDLILNKLKLKFIDFQLGIEKIRLALGKWLGMSKEQEARIRENIKSLEANKKAAVETQREIIKAMNAGATAVEATTSAIEDDWEGTTRVIVDGVEEQVAAHDSVQQSITNTADTYKEQSKVMDEATQKRLFHEEMLTRIYGEQFHIRLDQRQKHNDNLYLLNLEQERNEQKLADAMAKIKEGLKRQEDERIESINKTLDAEREVQQEVLRLNEEKLKNQERLRADWAKVGEAFDETLNKWKAGSFQTSDVVSAWATAMNTNTDAVQDRLAGLEVETSNVHAVLEAFARETGHDFFEWAEKTGLAIQKNIDKLTEFEKLTGVKSPLHGMAKVLDDESMTYEERLAERRKGTMFDPKVKAGFDAMGLTGSDFADYAREAIRKGSGADIFGSREFGIEKITEEGKRIVEASHRITSGVSASEIRRAANDAMSKGEDPFKAAVSVANTQMNEQIKEISEKGLDIATHSASGIPKKAGGGFAGGLTLVGERGPELVSLPGGSFVHPNGTGPRGQVNNFVFNGAVYGVEEIREVVVEAVRDHAIAGGFAGVFAEA